LLLPRFINRSTSSFPFFARFPSTRRRWRWSFLFKCQDLTHLSAYMPFHPGMDSSPYVTHPSLRTRNSKHVLAIILPKIDRHS
jgi:hypothetical protein